MSCFMGLSNDAANHSPQLTSSLQLDYGPGFGEQHYTTQNMALAFEMGEHLSEVKARGGTPSIDEAIRFIRKNAKSNPRDSDSLLSTLSLLRHYPHLQPREDDPHVIDLYEVLKKKEGVLIMVSLDGLSQGPIARLIAALFNANVLAAKKRIADEHESEHSPLHHTFWFFDEAQHLLSRSMASYLTGAAGFSLTYALSVQSLSGLKTRSMDHRGDVWNNTAIKCIHSSFEESDIRALQSFSREVFRPVESRKVSNDFRFVGRQAFNADSEYDRLEPMLTRREVLEVSKMKNRCFVVCDGGDFEPVPTDTFYAETYEQHLANRAKPWPKSPSPLKGATAKERIPERNGKSSQPAWLNAHLSANKTPVHAARIERYNALLKKLCDENLPQREE